MKKEYYLPLATIIGAIIIAVSIYMTGDSEYRDKKKACIELLKN